MNIEIITKLPDNSFYMIFDVDNRKEYYFAKLNNYKIKNIKNDSLNTYHIEHSSTKVIPKSIIKKASISHIYEERLGTFLTTFLNARFNVDWQTAYNDFFYKYGFELLKSIYNKSQINDNYKNLEEFKLFAEKVYSLSKTILIEEQTYFRDLIDFMYCLNKYEHDEVALENDSGFNFQSVNIGSLKHIEYLKETYVYYNKSRTSVIKNGYAKQTYLEAPLSIDKMGAILSSENIGSMVYMSIYEIAFRSVSIKLCKNCGRYFMPINRQAEVYCDLPQLDGSKKTCRELGARLTYSKNINNVEGLLLYRRTYQRRLMELSRKADATQEEKDSFNIWKKSAQAKIKEFKSEKITEKELNKWMRDNT